MLRRTAISLAGLIVAAILKIYSDTDIKAYFAIGLIIVVLIFLDEWFGEVRAQARLDETAPAAMDIAAEPILALCRTKQIDVRINFMKADRTLRWLGIKKYFIVYWCNNMFNHPDVNIIFPVTEGVSGVCYKERAPRIANQSDIEKYKISDKYLDDGIKNLTIYAVFSYPVYDIPRRGRQTGRVTGVINLDSTAPNAYTIFSDATFVGQIQPYVEGLARLAARFYR